MTRPYVVPPALLATLGRTEPGAGAQRRDFFTRRGPRAPAKTGGGDESPLAATPDREQLPIGSLVARKYRVVAHLGRGGCATIALAAFRGEAGVSKLVVLKCASAGGAGGAALLAEARLAARMNHQHVVQVFDVAEHEGMPVIVMEHLDGRSLANVMTAARNIHELDRSLKLDIVARMLAGLHYAHDLCDLAGRPLHVVHRDVSPHNVVLTCDGQVKLIDFGIAQWGARPLPSAASRVAGKLGYMAPEQLHGAADRRADIFAAGVVLWELLTLRRFWARAPQAEVMRRLLDRDIPRRASLEADLGSELASICRRALAPDPDERYATAAQMQADIERALQDRPASAADRAIGRVVRRLQANEGLARQRDLHEALRELEAAGGSAGVVAPMTAGARAAPRRRGDRRAVAILALALLLQWGGAPSGGAPSGGAPSRHHPVVTRSPEPPAPPQADAARTGASALEVGSVDRSTTRLPLGGAENPGALPSAERAASREPAAAPRREPPPTPRRASRASRARTSRAASSGRPPPPVGPTDARVADLEPGIDLHGLRQAARALPSRKGGGK